MPGLLGKGDGATVELAALETRTRKKSIETEIVTGKRAQRIPSWPGVIHSNKGRIHLRRPTCDIPTLRLRRSGGPYIPSGRNPSRIDAKRRDSFLQADHPGLGRP